MKKHNNLLKCVLKTATNSYPIQIDETISIGMGQPSFDPEDIGLLKSEFANELNLPGVIYHTSCVSIGNPHLVLFCKNIPKEREIITLGSMLENHSLFKNRINVLFAQVVSGNEIALSVFERGAGLTMACGSGACAAAAVAFAENFVSSKNVLVHQKGGILSISHDESGNILQSGPACHVFSGEMDI
jgi:diaminopimelate epimerase